MSRSIKRHPVELLIITYLKKLSKTNNNRSEKNILDKLSKMIGAVLEDPCCTDTVVNFNTPKETYIIISVKNALNGVDVRKWRESLERSKAAIDAKISNPCCVPPAPSIFQIQGAGSADNVCIVESTTFFSTSEIIEIGTLLYEDELLTPVGSALFRDDATGIVYSVEDGVVTGIAGDGCTQALQIQNLTGDASLVTGAEVDDVPVTFEGGTDFPIPNSQTGDFKTESVAPGLKTFKITVTGGTQIFIVDSALNNFVIPVVGPGTYTQAGVYFSGPNLDTAGVGITLL